MTTFNILHLAPWKSEEYLLQSELLNFESSLQKLYTSGRKCGDEVRFAHRDFGEVLRGNTHCAEGSAMYPGVRRLGALTDLLVVTFSPHFKVAQDEIATYASILFEFATDYCIPTLFYLPGIGFSSIEYDITAHSKGDWDTSWYSLGDSKGGEFNPFSTMHEQVMSDDLSLPFISSSMPDLFTNDPLPDAPKCSYKSIVVLSDSLIESGGSPEFNASELVEELSSFDMSVEFFRRARSDSRQPIAGEGMVLHFESMSIREFEHLDQSIMHRILESRVIVTDNYEAVVYLTRAGRNVFGFGEDLRIQKFKKLVGEDDRYFSDLRDVIRRLQALLSLGTDLTPRSAPPHIAESCIRAVEAELRRFYPSWSRLSL